MMDKDITDPSFKYAPSQNPIDPLNSSGSAALPNTMAQQVDFVPSGDDFADKIDRQTRQRVADQTNAMNLAISKAAAGNPDEAAAAQRLGYETGVGADIASRNMKTLQERAAVDRIGQLDLMRADPILAKMLSDQNFAAIALDDVENLQSTGSMLDSVMEVKNEFLAGREYGYATTKLGRLGGKMLQDFYLGKPLLETDRAEARRQIAEMQKLRGSGGFAESFGALEGQMESGLPQQIEMAGVGAVAGGAILGLPSGGIGLVPGMIAGAELGFLSASAVQSFEIESGSSFIDLLEQDIPEDTARTAATIVGTINAALEMIPLKFFTSRAKSLIKSTVQEQVVSSLVQVPGIKNAVGKFIKEWTMGIGVESVTEVVQEVTNITAEEFAKYETDPEFQAKMTTPEGRMEVANRLLETFETVAKGMAVMGFIMPGANFALDAKRARKANKTKQFFKDIGKDAATSKVRERNPNSYQAWFAERAKGTGAETIFVDVDKVRGAMVRNGINQEQLQFLLPDLYKQLQAIGANSGVDVTIPTSVYAARLVDTAFGQDLQSDMRLNPDDMSINDNNEYVKSRDTRVAELVKLSEEMTASDEILAESAKVVENRVVSEIMAVGKYTELEAKAMAAAHVAFAVVNAQSLNMTPDQFDIQYGMATRGEGQATPAAPLEQAAMPPQPSYPVLAEAWNKYLDGEEYGTTNDLADTIEGLIDSDEAPQGLADALDQFREEQAYDREVGGRGDMDTANKAFESAVQAAAEQMTAPPSALEQAATVSATTYSALDKAVGEVTAKSLVASGWKEQIKGWVNKGIVKQSEVEWSGLVEYLDMQEGKITKETVSKFLKNNGVKVETVTLGDRLPVLKTAVLKGIDDAQAALTELYNTDRELKDEFETYRKLVEADAPRDQLAEARIPINDRLENEFGTSLDEYIEDAYKGGAEAKYSRYVLPGGENYREVLVTLPVDQKARDAAQAKFNEFVAAGMSLIEAKEQAEKSLPGEFRSSHWDESNVLVHLRMNDRTDADGKRVLFVEEVQSDWGQQGKKVGFEDARGRAAALALLPIEQKKLDELTQEYSAISLIDQDRAVLLYEKAEAQRTVVENLQYAAYGSINIAKAPFVETTDGWLNLGLKHVMLEAVNGGYDRVAFVTGAQSAERYDLSKQVDQIVVSPRGEQKQVNIVLSAGNMLPFKVDNNGKISETNDESKQYAPVGTPLADVIGKELAEKIMQTERGTFEGNDLKVGGEGMNDFYDKIVPAAMNKLLKKYGGGKLGTTKIQAKEMPPGLQQELNEMSLEEQQDQISFEVFGVDSYDELNDRSRDDVDERIRNLANKGGTQSSFDVTAAFIEKVGQGLPLFQAAPSPGRRGSFDPTRLLTTLNTKADLSTFLHESSHFFFSVYTDIASRPGAPARIAADVQILLDSFGVKDIAAWNAMTFEEQRKYQEQFAYNFEIYLFEGKAPSIEMQGLFERFSKWLRRVYTSISTELNDIYRREFGEDLPILTDEIRGVMGRMLASEAQIKRAEAVNEMKPQFQTQAESGMDDARWAAYQAMIEEAHDQAVTDLTKASLRQMEWLSNARSRLLKNMQSKHDEIRKEMRTEIEAEVMAEPLYMAMSILKTGQGRAKNGELVQFNDKFKLNLEAVKKMLPSEEIAKLGYGKYGMVSEDGIPPDMVAEIVGFVSGDELVLALLTAKPAKEEIAARLDKRMMDEYGKMNTPEAKEAAVQAAIHNEARERFVAVEARFIAKATQPVRVMIDAAKAAARQIVGAKKIDDISPGEYAAAEARASRDAAEAYKDRQTPDAASKSTYTRVYNEQIAKGVDEATAVAEATSKAADASTKAQGKADAYKAKYGDRTPEQVIIRAKQAQVLQNQLVKEATSSLDEVDTAVKDFRKFFGSDEKIAKSRNMDLVDAARAILSYYGFGKVGKNPADYIAKLEAYNPEMYATIKPLIDQASTGLPDYTQMTMDDFRMLRDVVDALWAQSRRDKQITVAGKKIALDGVLSELDARLNEIGVPTTVPGEKSALTTKQKFAAHLYSAKALLRRVENWADATDGAGGVGAFTKYIYRPVKDAVNAYRVDRNNYVKRFVDLVSTLDLPVGKITSPEIDYTFGVGNGGIGKAELLGAMLHTGNESNYKKLLVGRGWGSLNSDGTLETARWDSFVQRMIAEGVLTKNDFDFLQSVWDLNEEIKPIAQKAHRDLYGYYFKEVEATQFTNTFGTYRGGYVPAKTDAAIVRDAQRQAKAEELDADFRSSMPSTGMGFTKSRVEYNKPLSLDVRLMAKHIDDVLRFANIQPAIKDALRIVNNREFADKLNRIDPTVVEFMLLPWLNRTARQSTNEPGRNKAVDKFWRVLRSRTGLAIMFANLRNALQQVTGLFPSALKVSKGALKDSLLTYLASPQKTAEAIAGLSPFMNERMHSQIFEIQDQMNDLLLNPNKFDKIQKWSQHHGYFLQSAFQNFVDIVTWNGKYNQVLSEIGTTLSDSEAQAEAIQQADAAVRSTQGSMSAEDVAAFEVGSPFYKTFVQFTGYFNMLANLNTDEYVKVLRDLGWRGNKGKLVSIYMLGFLAPTLVADAIARSLGAGWDNDDDGYLDDVADWFFGSQVRAGAAMVPFGSAAYTALSAGFTDKTYDDRITSSPSVGSLEASTVGVGKAIVNLASDDKELEGRNVRDVLTLITNATGVPVSVLGRPIGYQMEVERGKIEPTGAIDYMRGLITGVPSAESKKK
jgi:hypothetical protein